MKLLRWIIKGFRQFFCEHDYSATLVDGKTRFICKRCDKAMGDYKL